MKKGKLKKALLLAQVPPHCTTCTCGDQSARYGYTPATPAHSNTMIGRGSGDK